MFNLTHFAANQHYRWKKGNETQENVRGLFIIVIQSIHYKFNVF